MIDTLELDLNALLALGRRHPRELHKLRQSITDALAADSDESAKDVWIPCDRFNRALSIGSMVISAQGDRGRIIRFDRNSQRALIEREDGSGTHMLRLQRLELRRGRPRKDTYAASTAVAS